MRRIALLGFSSALCAGAALAQEAQSSWNAGAVYVMTNSADHNEVLMFDRAPNGSLRSAGRVSTGGRGSGGAVDPLGSQGSLTLSEDHQFLLAVNAGSGNVSSFRVRRGGDLKLADVENSGGSAPVSVAVWGDLVYVLNFAGNSNVVGFHMDDDGHLSAIPNSIRYLSTANSGASSLVFTPDGKSLLVSEKLTNLIDVFPVNGDGTLGTVVSVKDSSNGLFDLAVTPEGAVLALEAGAGTLSSFLVQSGTLTPLGTPAATNGMASCWSAVTPNGKWVYTANAGSGNVSGFAISGAGLLSPLSSNAIVATLPAGSTDLDIAISADSKYLYSLNTGAGTVGIFKINPDGTLGTPVTLAAFTAKSGFNGIAAY